ncbi:hypothetical protein PTKIN_Ptkin05aG0196900 [Pterospermum kingtungense]
MAFSLSTLSKSLPSLANSQPVPSPSTTLQLPKKASTFAPLVSPKSTPKSLTSSLATADEITAITCPSLAYSNTLFFKSGIYNVQVVVADNEPEEKLLGRFRRAVFKAGVIQECRRRRFFETSQEKRKRKAREASKKNRKSFRRPQPRVLAQAKEESPKKKDDDEVDNWELPEGDLPYCDHI